MAEQVVINVLGMLENVAWMWGICQLELKEKKLLILSGIFMFFCFGVIAVLESLYGRDIYTQLADAFTNLAVCCMIFRGKISCNVIKYFFSIFYIMAFYNPIKLIYALFDLNDIYIFFNYKSEIFSVITICSILCLSIWIKKRKSWVNWIQKIPIGYYILGMIFAIAASGISYFIDIYSDVWEDDVQIFIQILQTIVMFFLYGSGIGVAFLNLWKENYRKESMLKDRHIQMLREHYQGLKEHMDEVQSLRHDMKSHILILKQYMESGEIGKAARYLEQIEEHQEWQNKPRVNMGNELVDAVLSNELRKMSPDITFSYEGVLSPELRVQEFDLCTLFSNLLSNSIEACEKLQYKEKSIHLSIFYVQNKLLISIKNPIEGEVDIKKLGTYTTKEDGFHHGYGILNIKETVEKYDGFVEFQAEEYFEVRITLRA